MLREPNPRASYHLQLFHLPGKHIEIVLTGGSFKPCLTKLITSSLSPGTKRSFECLFYPIDFPIFVDFDNGFDVDMLSFRLIEGVIRI